MDNDVKIWLYDILTSINEIESYYVDVPKMFQISNIIKNFKNIM